MNIFRSKVDVFEAINRCDWQKVKDAVVPGKANQRDGQYDATLLHWTVNEGHVPTVEHLLSCGAAVGARDGKNSATPLHWAGAKGHVFVVRLLMMQEADVNSRDSSNRTPLHWAAGNGQLGVIRELLFWGARVECTDLWEKIPLHWAAFRGHVSSVEELVGRGSPVDKADADGNVPGGAFHTSVPEEARKAIRTAMKQGPASGDSVVRAATVSSELLLETLHACRSWGELFENRQFEQLSKECQDHRERLRGFIQGLADQGKAGSLEQCLKAMDLLNSALGLHEDMRNGTKPVPLEGVEHGRRRPSAGGLDGRDAQHDSGSPGPPRAGGEMRSAEDLREFLAPAPGGARPLTIGQDGTKGGAGSGAGSSAASLRLYQLPAVREACGGFDPQRCIGEGGFGKVYRGSMMGLPVAVKKLDETGLQGREQFFREVEVLSTCRHENIVPLLGVCTEPPCLVYRLMPNNSLRHHLDDPALKARLGWRLRVAMTMQMCSGLDYLHSESTNKPKVIHGDIKPENILLDEYRKARLSDFGISRVGESEAGGAARPRARRGVGRPAEVGSGGRVPPEADGLQGTFGYMDPVYQSTGRLDERSDVYSLGVVMLELLTGDLVYCPDKDPPGLVDRVRKALEDRTLKNVVDRSAVWSKTAAKAYARLACACCAEDPANRPSLREVLEKVEAIQEMGNKNAGAGVADSSRSVDLLQLFDPEHNDQVGGGTAVNGGHSIGAVVGMGGSVGTGDSDHDVLARGAAIPANFGASLSKGNRSSVSSVPMQQPRPPPPPPPPPYQNTIQNLVSAASTEPPTYMEAVAAEGKREAVVDVEYSTDTTAGATSAASPLVSSVSPGTRVSSGGISMAEDMSTVTMRYTANDAQGSTGIGTGTAAWWSASSVMGSGRGGTRGAGTVAGGGGAEVAVATSGGKAEGFSSRSQRHALLGPLLRGSSVFAGRDQGVGAVSCTRSTSLAEYDVDLPGVLKAAMGGGVLSSNARLLCVCCTGPPPEASGGDMRPSPEASATLPPAEGQGQMAKPEVGHVSVMDLWHRGRTVRYPAAADKAAMSPNQSESVIAVFGGGSLHVFSIPRRLLLQELAVATELAMWRWLSPWGLALVTRNAVFYWSVTETVSHASSSPGNDGIVHSSSGGAGGGKEHPGESTHDVDAAARLRRPRQAFQRRRTLTAPGSHHRVYDYQASADGRWGMLLCAVVDSEPGDSCVQVGDVGSPPLNNGYVGNSGDAEGGGSPVKVDLYSFERAQTFEFEVLGAALMIMPGSNPPLNLLGLVIRGDGGGAELRVLDLDRSLAQAEGPEALSRLASQGEGWIIATTHVIAEEDLRGSAAYRIVDRSDESATGGIPMAPLVSPPVFLRQWTENTNVLFMIGCHGLLLLLDVVTGAELARAQACVPPVVEAEVDPDVGDLVVVSSADGGGIHRLTVRAAALRESVEYDHKDAEMATRVSAMTGYSGVRPVPPPTRTHTPRRQV